MDEKNKVLEALIEIQADLKAPKGQYNDFAKFSFRSCEDILSAVKPLLKKHGCLLTLSDQIVSIGGWNYVEAEAVFEKPPLIRTVSAKGYAREQEVKKGMDAAQITGACSSYARKYALNGLFCIDDGKDADSDTKEGEIKQTRTVQPAGPEDVIGFGKHKGTKWSQVEGEYLDWCIKSMDDGERKDRVQQEIDERTNADSLVADEIPPPADDDLPF